jgi:flagellar biosynthesis protein FlhF
MIVRSYTGRTVPEALTKVRNDLGDNALIIETRIVRESNLLRRRTGYEVVAAHDDTPSTAEPRGYQRQPARPAVATRPLPDTASTTDAYALPAWQPPDLSAGQQANNLARSVNREAPVDHSHRLDKELASIRRQLSDLAHGRGTATSHLGAALAAQVADQELPSELVAELDSALERAHGRIEPHQHHEFLSRLMAQSLPCAGEVPWDECRHLLVVGPTGVGKTTTIAKLAGELVLKAKRSVALVTIDTYRVGATEQLRAYADLLEVPLEVATSPAQLASALRRFEKCDNVLIDTAGRSPSDTTRVHELKSYCRASGGLKVMLAVAATCGRAEFAAVVERFSILPIEYGVITKLDECVSAGRLYGCLRRHRLPLNYISIGQEVPNDIVPASADRLVRGVLEAPSRASA